MVHNQKLAGNSRDDQIWQLGDRLSQIGSNRNPLFKQQERSLDVPALETWLWNAACTVRDLY
jgi:hypothetical protein